MVKLTGLVINRPSFFSSTKCHLLISFVPSLSSWSDQWLRWNMMMVLFLCVCMGISKRKKEGASESCVCLGCPGNNPADKATESLGAAMPREWISPQRDTMVHQGDAEEMCFLWVGLRFDCAQTRALLKMRTATSPASSSLELGRSDLFLSYKLTRNTDI